MFNNLNESERGYILSNLYELKGCLLLREIVSKPILNKNEIFDLLLKYDLKSKHLNQLIDKNQFSIVKDFISENCLGYLKEINEKDNSIDENNLILNLLNFFTFDYDFFDFIADKFNIPEKIKLDLIKLTQGINYLKEKHNDEDEELLDDYIDSVPTSYDFLYVLDQLCDFANIDVKGLSKAELGTKDYFNSGYDKYFQSDFEDIKDCLSYDEDGFVEDSSYHDAFESDDFLVAFKIKNNNILKNLSYFVANYSSFYQYLEFFVYEDNGLSKIEFNEGIFFEGVTVSFISLLVIYIMLNCNKEDI